MTKVKTPMNRVWIELERPRDNAHAVHICELANVMMNKLCPKEAGAPESEFFWDARDQVYCWGGHMGYRTLSDRGEWFNLDYLGRV